MWGKGTSTTSNEDKRTGDRASPLHGIQPMPTTVPEGCLPGAHAVAGPARFARPPPPRPMMADDTGTSHTTADLTASDANHAAATLDAFLVDSEQLKADVDRDSLGPEYAGGVGNDIEEVSAVKLPQRHDEPERRVGRRCRSWGLLLFTAAIVGSIAITVLLVMVQQKDSASSQSTAFKATNRNSTGSETTPTYPPYLDSLPAHLVKAIQDPTTPQSKANGWMWNDPQLAQYSEARQKKRFSLASFYYSTNGDGWTRNDHWLDYTVSECYWFSTASSNQPAICDTIGDEDHLVTLDLRSNNLTGTLPSNFWGIEPRYLDLSNNQIEGSLTKFVADMEWLEVLVLAHNRFAGPTLGDPGLSISNLRVVDIEGNCFGGNNGLLWRRTPKITHIDISNNCGIQEIPIHGASLPDLRYFGCANNQFYGTMASELGMLTSLEVWDVSGNLRLSGSLPSELNQWTNLVELNLMGTSFTGSIPMELCKRSELGLLQIQANCTLVDCC